MDTPKKNDRARFLFWIAILNILVALNTYWFWIGFFTQWTFPIDELSLLIDNFEGYYAWERCFVVPDVILATAAIYASYKIIKDSANLKAKTLLAACAGAWMFLGVLDFTYGITNGMYTLGHPFSHTLIGVGVGLPIVGGITLFATLRSLDAHR